MLDARSGGSVIGLCLVVLAISGSVAASGTTDVALSPESDTVEPGETVSYDVVVAAASGGVGSFDATVATNDSDVATVRTVSYPGDPAYSHQPSGSDDVQLAASGMETLDDGPVRVATVTVATADAGAVRLSLSVSALGDENGSAYTVAQTRGRTLVVGDGAAPTPTATPTETDGEDPSSGSDGASGDDPSAGDSSDSDSTDDDETADDSTDDDETADDPTDGDQSDSDGATDAGTETVSPSETPTSSPTTPAATKTSSDAGAVAPTASNAPTALVLGGVVLALVVAGLVYYRL